MRSSPILVGLATALIWACGAHSAVSQLIYAYFDQDGNIEFRYADSSNVGSTIPPGAYTVDLNNNGADDEGVDHIFHLFGPGINYEAANVDTVATFTVTFQAGATYTIQDALNPTSEETILATTAPQAAQTTTSAASGSGGTGSKAPTSVGIVGSGSFPFRGSLDAIVYANGKTSLSRNGNRVSYLKTGRYTFSVDDESPKSGFTVQILHGNPVAITTGSYVGSHDRTLELKPGRWFYFGPGGKKTTFFVTS